MDEKTLFEDNKLVAEFMGMKHTKIVFDSHGYEQYTYTIPDELSKQVYGYVGAECFLENQFSKSWDWLMPVYLKIVKLIQAITEIETSLDREGIILFDKLHDCLRHGDGIDEVWKATVKFIKWYNKNISKLP